MQFKCQRKVVHTYHEAFQFSKIHQTYLPTVHVSGEREKEIKPQSSSEEIQFGNVLLYTIQGGQNQST